MVVSRHFATLFPDIKYSHFHYGYIYINAWTMIQCLIAVLLAVHPQMEEKPTLILNATAVLGNGGKIENAAIAFQNGRFLIVGDATAIKFNLSLYDVIYAEGKFIYPLDMVQEKLAGRCILSQGKEKPTIKEGDKASFALLSAPLSCDGAVEKVFIDGRERLIEQCCDPD
jgi:hypothetical protein